MNRLLAFLVGLFLVTPALADSAFGPGGNTVSLAVTGTTGRVLYQATPTHPNVRVFNSGAVITFIACGDVSVVATTGSGMPVAPGTVEVIGCSGTYVAAITASGTSTIYLTPGTGI